MNSLNQKCVHCGETFGNHSSLTYDCPIELKPTGGHIFHPTQVFEAIPASPSRIEEIKTKLEAHRNDLSILTAEERNILSADGVARMRGPLEAAAAKVSKIGNVTDEEFKARGEELNRLRISRGYATIRAHDEAAGTENDGLEERLTCLLANLMHVCQSTGQPEIFMRALHMANTHFAAEINQD